MKFTAITLFLFSWLLGAADLGKSLVFHAGFDGSTDARRAAGDPRIYSAASYKEQSAAKPGLDHPDVELTKGNGRFGGALWFKKKNERAIFYRAERNAAFDAKNWTGTISFWLSLDPNQDLAPGFCDPIQITDKAYNDDAIWVDFTKDERPRHFRLGVFGELKAWNPQNVESDKNPAFNERLVVNRNPPFARGQWTHLAIAFSGLGSGKGVARLYLNGQLQGATPPIGEAFAWDATRGAIRLGVNYTGLFDDLAVFNRALSDSEVKELYTLKQGAASLR